MNSTKFYNIDNRSLHACSLYEKELGYVRPYRRQRSTLSRMAPWAIALLVGVGFSLIKIAGA